MVPRNICQKIYRWVTCLFSLMNDGFSVSQDIEIKMRSEVK